jgi:hypothetical protein
MRAGRRSDSGMVAMMAAFGVVLLMVTFTALVFNLGVLMANKNELQNASDSSALAAATELDGTLAGMTASGPAAAEFSAVHTTYGQPVLVGACGGDLTLGRWDFLRQTFQPDSCAPANPFTINAVKILNGRDGVSGHNEKLPVAFSSLMGRTDMSVTSQTIAVGLGAAARCALPLAIPECAVAVSGNGHEPSCFQRFLRFTGTFSTRAFFLNLRSPHDTPSDDDIVAAMTGSGRCATDDGRYLSRDDYQLKDDGANPPDGILPALLGYESLGGGVYTRCSPASRCPCAVGHVVTLPVVATGVGCPGDPSPGSTPQKIVRFVRVRINHVNGDIPPTGFNDPDKYTDCIGPSGVPPPDPWVNPPKLGSSGDIAFQLQCDGSALDYDHTANDIFAPDNEDSRHLMQ